MGAQIVYTLCGLTSLACAFFLLKHYRRTGLPLLFWAGIAFCAFTATNILLYVDLVVVGPRTDLNTLRTSITLIGVLLLLYGLIRENT